MDEKLQIEVTEFGKALTPPVVESIANGEMPECFEASLALTIVLAQFLTELTNRHGELLVAVRALGIEPIRIDSLPDELKEQLSDIVRGDHKLN